MPTKVLGVPYFTQLDNELNPSGSCNVTSVGMCLWFAGIRGDGSYPQLEDQLYQRCADNNWDRHDPGGLKKLVESYPNMKDDLTKAGTLADIRTAIDQGTPCVVSGYFTRSGHIVVIKGYDDTGFIVNDPYGVYYKEGYNTSESGEGVHYSNDLISHVCSPESEANPKDIWLHRIYKGTKK